MYFLRVGSISKNTRYYNFLNNFVFLDYYCITSPIIKPDPYHPQLLIQYHSLKCLELTLCDFI